MTQKKMQSFRLEEGKLENAQNMFSKFGLNLNKSETVELALDLLALACEDIFREKPEHISMEFELRKKAVLSHEMERVAWCPEVKDIADKYTDDYFDYFWQHYEKK